MRWSAPQPPCVSSGTCFRQLPSSCPLDFRSDYLVCFSIPIPPPQSHRDSALGMDRFTVLASRMHFERRSNHRKLAQLGAPLDNAVEFGNLDIANPPALDADHMMM